MANVKDSPIADSPEHQKDLDKLRAGVEAAKARLSSGRMELEPEPEPVLKKKPARRAAKPRKKR